MLNESFNHEIDEWLEQVVKIKVKQSTYYTYKYRITKYIKPYFEGNSIADVSLVSIREFIINLKHEKEGKALSAQTIRGIIMIINEFYKYQIMMNNLSVNPCLGVSLPTIRRKKVEMLSEREQNKLLSYLIKENSPRAYIIITALFTGMRIGELCSLRWSDIDLRQKMITVSTTKQRVMNPDLKSRTQVIIDTPKTYCSRRKIPISKFLVEKLLRIKSSQIGINDMVFTKKNNTGYDVRSIQKYYTKVCAKLLIRKTNFHCLRHTFATRAIQSQIDIKTLSLLLGHSSASTTLNLYVHPDERHMRNKIEIISQYMSKRL